MTRSSLLTANAKRPNPQRRLLSHPSISPAWKQSIASRLPGIHIIKASWSPLYLLIHFWAFSPAWTAQSSRLAQPSLSDAPSAAPSRAGPATWPGLRAPLGKIIDKARQALVCYTPLRQMRFEAITSKPCLGDRHPIAGDVAVMSESHSQQIHQVKTRQQRGQLPC